MSAKLVPDTALPSGELATAHAYTATWGSDLLSHPPAGSAYHFQGPDAANFKSADLPVGLPALERTATGPARQPYPDPDLAGLCAPGSLFRLGVIQTTEDAADRALQISCLPPVIEPIPPILGVGGVNHLMFGKTALLAFSLSALALNLQAGNITWAWDYKATTKPDGFVMYMGPRDGDFPRQVIVPYNGTVPATNISLTISNIPAGTHIVGRVTAFRGDINNMEQSEPSNKAETTIGGTNAPPRPVRRDLPIAQSGPDTNSFYIEYALAANFNTNGTIPDFTAPPIYPLLSIRREQNQLVIDVSGEYGKNAVLEASRNFTDWNSVSTNRLLGHEGTTTFTWPIDQLNTVFRVRQED